MKQRVMKRAITTAIMLVAIIATVAQTIVKANVIMSQNMGYQRLIALDVDSVTTYFVAFNGKADVHDLLSVSKYGSGNTLDAWHGLSGGFLYTRGVWMLGDREEAVAKLEAIQATERSEGEYTFFNGWDFWIKPEMLGAWGIYAQNGRIGWISSKAPKKYIKKIEEYEAGKE